MKVDLYWPNAQERKALDVDGNYPALYVLNSPFACPDVGTKMMDHHVTLFYKYLKPDVTPEQVEAALESMLEDGIYLRNVEFEDQVRSFNKKRGDSVFTLYYYHPIDSRLLDIQRKLVSTFCTHDIPYIPPHLTVAIDNNVVDDGTFGSTFRSYIGCHDDRIYVFIEGNKYYLCPWSAESFVKIMKFIDEHKCFFNLVGPDDKLTCSHPEFFTTF